MATEKVEKVEKKEDPRAEKWAAFLDLYKKQSPAKFAVKEAKGDFKDIPADFK